METDLHSHNKAEIFKWTMRSLAVSITFIGQGPQPISQVKQSFDQVKSKVERTV